MKTSIAMLAATAGALFVGGGPTRHMMCDIPGGIRVEFIAT